MIIEKKKLNKNQTTAKMMKKAHKISSIMRKCFAIVFFLKENTNHFLILDGIGLSLRMQKSKKKNANATKAYTNNELVTK